MIVGAHIAIGKSVGRFPSKVTRPHPRFDSGTTANSSHGMINRERVQVGMIMPSSSNLEKGN